MQTLWSSWRVELETNPDLLHHFLGLMLSDDGNCDMALASAGSGPQTVRKCIYFPFAYTLALCTGLPTSLRTPKSQRPGNIGDIALDGHSCGIETLRGVDLHIVDKTHQWRTAIVLLPNLKGEWAAYDESQLRLDEDALVRQSLKREPPSSVVLPRDKPLLTAMKQGLVELKKVLAERCQLLQNQQANYVDKGAGDV